MKLSDFVANTVNELIEAHRIIDKKQAELQEGGLQLIGDRSESFKYIDFDIMVTLQDTDKKGGSGGINVYDVVKIGGKKGKEKVESHVNRIQFQVGFATPKQEHYKTQY